MTRFVVAMASVGLLGVALSSSARADEWNKKTVMTVSEPIQVPNKVLPAGTYVIKLLDSPSDRHIVQIFDANETHLETTILAIPELSNSAHRKDGVHVLGNASRTTEGFEGLVLSRR